MPPSKRARRSSSVQEVTVTAPRMGRFESGLYDRKQMTPQQRQAEAIDVATGFISPIGITRGIDIRKLSKMQKLGEKSATAGSSVPVDNLANQDSEKYAKGGMVRKSKTSAKRKSR